jgi:hypothetical protein
MSYRLPNSRKSNFATEPANAPRDVPTARTSLYRVATALGIPEASMPTAYGAHGELRHDTDCRMGRSTLA